MSKKLFKFHSFNLQFFDFISNSSLKQTFKTEPECRNWVIFALFTQSSYPTFIWISFNRNSFIFVPFIRTTILQLLLNGDVIIDVLRYLLLLYIYSRILSGSLIRCVWSKQENTIRRLNLFLLFYFCTGYWKNSFGLEKSWCDFTTNTLLTGPAIYLTAEFCW